MSPGDTFKPQQKFIVLRTSPCKASNLFPLGKIGCIWESEAGGFGVPGQPELHNETLLQQ